MIGAFEQFEDITRAMGYEIAQSNDRPSNFYLIPKAGPDGPLEELGGSPPRPLGPYESGELTHGVVIAIEQLISVLVKLAAEPGTDPTRLPISRLQAIAEVTGATITQPDLVMPGDMLDLAERLNHLAVKLVVKHHSDSP